MKRRTGEDRMRGLLALAVLVFAAAPSETAAQQKRRDPRYSGRAEIHAYMREAGILH
jgi:hypothetical protein